MGTALNESAWSTTPASNDGADSTIGTVANTSSPTSVDDWVRGQMASRARARLDQGGALVAGGTSTALTVTTNQALSSPHIANGLRLCVRTASAATGASWLTTRTGSPTPPRETGVPSRWSMTSRARQAAPTQRRAARPPPPATPQRRFAPT